MQKLPDFHAHDPRRRGFLRVAAGFAGMIVLAGCGGGGNGTETGGGGVTVVGGSAGTPPAGPVIGSGVVSGEAALLNLALNLEYLGAQFHAYAATGEGLPAALLSGVGPQGAVTGGRRVAFTDPLIGRYAAELVADKQTKVAGLRQQLGASAAAQPAIDLSAGTSSAFANAARAAGVGQVSAGLDPFAGDGNFLLAAALLENAVAANYRVILPKLTTAALLDTAADNLAAAIYHAGLIRSMLTARAEGDASIAGVATFLWSYAANLDGSDVGDQTLAGSPGESSNIIDADGCPIPFKRDATQILKALYLSPAAIPGGFLPAGANGLRAA